ncbi:hypothetical protein [Paenibacillus sp. Soil522]|uniref:hypothetical protein n=1 Tax=Paenibacillus sp. Soil522 TaxID=1736388 RepID=UPI0006FD3428|nr:hypothetical protein [Paenibacillus sp. Soil522]KRE50916.1 hypothetical protein ASG81_03790 [Paenibacillus sp. Soil522]
MTNSSRVVFVGALLMLTLSACTNQRTVDMVSSNHGDTEGKMNTVTSSGTEQNIVPKEENSPSSQENTDTDEMKAIKDAQELLELIKEKDSDKLLRLLNKSARSRLDIEGVNTIIEGFDANFDLKSLSVQINNDGPAMYPEGGQYEFVLVDKNFKGNHEENSLVIRYQEDGGIVYHNPYIQYFPYAEKLVVKYLDLIDEGNTTELAGFLNPDDVDVPDWVADDIIRNYKNFFNSDMSVRYKNRFTFVIEDSKGKEHEIEVIYGAGLLSIKDEFIPNF